MNSTPHITLVIGASGKTGRRVAERLVAAIREGDTVARLGGDEFIILLEGVNSPKDVAAIAKKILTQLENPVRIQGHSMTVGASIGIALYPDDGNDPEH